MKDITHILSYIVIGAVVIAAFQSPQTSGVANSLFGGFAGIIGAMTGHPAAAAAGAAQSAATQGNLPGVGG